MKRFTFGLLIFLFILAYPVKTQSSGARLSIKKLEENLLLLQKRLLFKQINSRLEKFYLELEDKHSQQYVINFITKLSHIAIYSEALPSIIIAQAAIETGYGRSTTLGNNIFGIKGRGITTKTKEWYNGKFITIYDQFQDFPSLDAAFKRHYQIIKRYNFKTRNYVEWAVKIKAGGYATDPNYAKKLIYIVKRYNLIELDKIQELNIKYQNL